MSATVERTPHVRPRGRGRGANGVPRDGDKKRRYVRTTAVGRAQKNLAKTLKTLSLVEARLVSWGGVSPPAEAGNFDLDVALQHVKEAEAAVVGARTRLGALEKRGFSPPKRSSVVTFSEGDRVCVREKHRERYLAVYPSVTIDRLVVSKVLPSGEIAVKHGDTAFIVPKSHLARREGKAG